MIYYESNRVVVRDSTYLDIFDLSNNMRSQEVAEIWASEHIRPFQAVHDSFDKSAEKRTFLYDGRVAGMFGVIPESYMSDKGIVWMLTTPEILKMKFTFYKLSRKFIASLLARYVDLYNFVDARNTQCVDWLKRCDAEIYPAEGFGVEKLPFHQIRLGAK